MHRFPRARQETERRLIVGLVTPGPNPKVYLFTHDFFAISLVELLLAIPDRVSKPIAALEGRADNR